MSESSDKKTGRSSKHVIDSYGWIEYFSNGKLADKYAKFIEQTDPSAYVTPSLIVYEVYKRIRSSFSEEEAIKAVIHIEARTEVMDIDTNIAIESADISLNEDLPMADAIIYAAARVASARLITSDRHFKGKSNVLFIE